MPALDNGDASRRIRLLGLASRKRAAAKQRRVEAERFESEATALTAEADRIAARLTSGGSPACPPSTSTP
jgi:hypothetical protein